MLQDIRNRGYWIQLLTARPKENLKCLHDTYYWLDNNDIPYDAIDFSSEKFRWCAKSRYYDAGKIEFAIEQHSSFLKVISKEELGPTTQNKSHFNFSNAKLSPIWIDIQNRYLKQQNN